MFKSAKKILSTAVVFSVVVLSGCTSEELPDASDTSWEAVQARANSQGEVTFYSVSPPAMTEPLIEAFNEKYPDIDVNFLRGAAELPAKVDAEISSGVAGADVFLYAGPLWHLDHESDLTPVDDLPALQEWPSDAWSKARTMPVSSFMPHGIIAWNKDIFPEGFKTWDDLLAPEVKGKLGIRDTVDTVVASYLQFQEDVNGDDYLNELAKNKPNFYSSVVPMTQAVASGEIGVTNMTVPAVINDLISQGAPLDYVVPEETWTSPYVVSVLEKSENKDAAKVFLNFMFSVEGQSAFNGDENGSSPLETAEGTFDISGHELTVLDPVATDAEAVADWAVKYDRIFK